MKKKLLLVVLALAILTSLTAGTLAVYTKTVSDSEQIEAKRFAFSASGDVVGEVKKIFLAPTEKMTYSFTIANADGGPAAEVPLKYDMTISFTEAFSKMPGLTATLYDGETKVGTYTEAGKITYSTTSAADESFEKTYTVVLEWVDDGDSNSGHTTAGTDKVTLKSGLNLSVVATQITE